VEKDAERNRNPLQGRSKSNSASCKPQNIVSAKLSNLQEAWHRHCSLYSLNTKRRVSMRRSKVIAIAILLFGSVALGLTACEDRGKEQTKGTTERDTAKAPGSPTNPQGPGGPTEPGKSR
jgi:hypothetical protein